VRSLDGDFSGLSVSDFTDHDHIGILPQKRSQCAGKRQASALVNADLIGPRQINLTWVFHARNIELFPVDVL
jgi:hypothetical protein